MDEIETFVTFLKGRASELLLASVKRPHLLELKTVTRKPRKMIHKYLEIKGDLNWGFKEGNWLFINIDSSGLVSIGGRSEFGLDPMHRNFKVPYDTNHIQIWLSESGELGTHRDLKLPIYCVVYERDEALYSLYQRIEATIDFIVMEQKWDLLQRMDNILKQIPSLPIESLSYFVHANLFTQILGENPYNFDTLRHVREFESGERVQEIGNLEQVNNELMELSKELNTEEDSKGQIEIVPFGNAHIDLAWLWPIAETKKKVQRTFSTVLSLMERRNFTFLQSMVTHYEFIRDLEPNLFLRIKKFAREKKWVPVGGMIVESDCNLIGGESLVRQCLYGQRYFKEEFGEYCKIAWLPDSFGFTEQLPQIFSKSRFELFLTTKFTYNDSTRFPHDIFEWKAPDGSEILAHSHMRTYSSEVDLKSVTDTIEKNPETSKLIGSVPLIYGYGDGGGGPTEEMLDVMESVNSIRSTFYTGSDAIDYWLSKVKAHESELPSITGELYLEAHRGTYTSHGDIKRMNRRIESELFLGDAISSIFKIRSRSSLKDEWKVLLANQFHDIIPGSAIDVVYQESLRELYRISKRIRRAYDGKTNVSSEGNTSFTIFSPYWWKTSAWISTDGLGVGCKVKDESQREYSIVFDGIEYGFYADLDRGMGIYKFQTIQQGKIISKSEEDSLLPLRQLHDWAVEVNDHDIISIRIDGQDLPIPELVLFRDFPFYFDAWELEDLRKEQGRVLRVSSIQRLKDEGFGEIIRVKYDLNPGEILMTMMLPKFEEFLKLRFDVDWQGNNRLLRMFLETGEGRCLGETAYSITERKSEGGKYEFPAHRFVAIESEGKTLLLLNDSKYGYSFRDGHLGVSLLRSPFYPDPFADRGKNTFSFSYGLTSSRDPIFYIKMGFKFNVNPVQVRSSNTIKRHLLAENAVIGALKASEEGTFRIVRIYNPTGSNKKFRIELPFEVSNLVETDLLENPLTSPSSEGIKQYGSTIEGDISAYEIKSLRLTEEYSKKQ
ncbi:MAG: glycosyl hydrolase-related protein [Candidatus Thermoplasmatota archaeon]|nr:glycosyl hydrolase-related protein [Candidatus Thermoplasmatota archaeon]